MKSNHNQDDLYNLCFGLTIRELVISPDLESVQEESSVQEDMCEPKGGYHNAKVEKLTEDEAKKINSKFSVDIFGKVLKRKVI